MKNTGMDKALTDLEIRIFSLEPHSYPVELTLAGQQEFPRGDFNADLVPWTSGGDLLADGRRLFDALLSDPQLRTAWATARGQAPQRRLRLRIDPAAAELYAMLSELFHEGSVMLTDVMGKPFID